MRLQQLAEKLVEQGGFTGGSVEDFEAVGRLQLAMLVQIGLYPDSKVLDVGCAALRGGYWLIHFLNSRCYFGIEPHVKMLEEGITFFLEPGLREAKQPTFDNNDRFDFSVFGEKFDVIVARSVWTHAPKRDIRVMLEGFVQHTNPDAFFLTSYLPVRWLRHRDYNSPGNWLKHRDYKGDQWVGRSHRSQIPSEIHHDFKWIERECRSLGLFVEQLGDGVLNWQHWLKITKKPELLQPKLSRYRVWAVGRRLGA